VYNSLVPVAYFYSVLCCICILYLLIVLYFRQLVNASFGSVWTHEMCKCGEVSVGVWGVHARLYVSYILSMLRCIALLSSWSAIKQDCNCFIGVYSFYIDLSVKSDSRMFRSHSSHTQLIATLCISLCTHECAVYKLSVLSYVSKHCDALQIRFTPFKKTPRNGYFNSVNMRKHCVIPYKSVSPLLEKTTKAVKVIYSVNVYWSITY